MCTGNFVRLQSFVVVLVAAPHRGHCDSLVRETLKPLKPPKP